jgi:hypothetical protein
MLHTNTKFIRTCSPQILPALRLGYPARRIDKTRHFKGFIRGLENNCFKNNKPIYRLWYREESQPAWVWRWGMYRVTAEWSWGPSTRLGCSSGWLGDERRESPAYSHTLETRWPVWRAPSTLTVSSACELLLPDSLCAYQHLWHAEVIDLLCWSHRLIRSHITKETISKHYLFCGFKRCHYLWENNCLKPSLKDGQPNVRNYVTISLCDCWLSDQGSIPAREKGFFL